MMNSIAHLLVGIWVFLGLFCWSGLMLLTPRPRWSPDDANRWRNGRFVVVIHALGWFLYALGMRQIPGDHVVRFGTPKDLVAQAIVAVGPALACWFVMIEIAYRRRRREPVTAAAAYTPVQTRTADRIAAVLALLWAPVSWEFLSWCVSNEEDRTGLGALNPLLRFVIPCAGLFAIVLFSSQSVRRAAACPATQPQSA